MSISTIVVKTTITGTNKDLLFGFINMDNAEKKMFELNQSAGYTGTVLYPYVEGYDHRYLHEEELYDISDSRYIDRFD